MLIYLSMIEAPDDQYKFEKIYKQYRNLMYHVAFKILKNHYDAEDAVHQAFVAVIRNLNTIDAIDCSQTRSLVVLITERKAIDILRINHHYQILQLNEEILGLEMPLPGDHGLADALAKLPANYREVLLLRFDNGLSTKELSNLLGMTQSGVRKLIGRAKEALRCILKEEGYFENNYYR